MQSVPATEAGSSTASMSGTSSSDTSGNEGEDPAGGTSGGSSEGHTTFLVVTTAPGARELKHLLQTVMHYNSVCSILPYTAV